MKCLQLSIFSLAFILGSCTINNTIYGNGKIVNKSVKTSDYDRIEVSGSFDVDLVQGSEGSIKISADENLIDLTDIKVDNNVLYISKKNSVSTWSSNSVKVEVPIQEISEIDLAGSGTIRTLNYQLNGKDLSIELSGSGEVDLNVNTKDLETDLAGSGDIILHGITKDLEVSLNGSGNIDAFDLKSKNVEVDLDGSGTVKVNPINNLDVNLSGSGEVIYKNSPKNINIDKTGSGEVRRY